MCVLLWDELCNFIPIPVCASIAGCCCNASKTIHGYRDGDAVMSFLQGLNDNYDVVRSQILLMEPLPTLPKVYSIILQQECQIGPSPTPDPLVAHVST